MELLTTRQAAERLGLTDRQVRNLCEAGHLPARKYGWSWLIRDRDLPRAELRPGKGRGRKKSSE
jgi:excisionase family DNA binding protein